MTIKPIWVKAELDEDTCSALESQARAFSRSRAKHVAMVLRGVVNLYESLSPEQATKLDSVLLLTDRPSLKKKLRQFLRELTRNSSSIPINSRSIPSSDGRN
jgi:hypothetical protein